MKNFFYKNLYKKQTKKTHSINDCTFLKQLKQLEEEDKIKCEAEISLKELGKNLRMLPNNKTPGCDGFTTEFYKFFWKDLKMLLHNSLIHSYKTGILSLDQRRAVLCLLPKLNKDLRYLKHWRPLSILNTDYKLIAKTLATRLQEVIGTIISFDQSGYLKGRFIGENIRTIIDTLQYTSKINTPQYMIFIDFEKAFDSVSWDFLFKTLEAFNFGENFINWVKILYNEPLLSVTNNGYAIFYY